MSLGHLPSPMWWRSLGKGLLEKMAASTGRFLGPLCLAIRCVCVRACACVRVRVCVCVCERERVCCSVSEIAGRHVY